MDKNVHRQPRITATTAYTDTHTAAGVSWRSPYEGDLTRRPRRVHTKGKQGKRGLCIYVGISYRAPERRLRVHLEDVDAVEVLGGLDLVGVRVEGLGFERVSQGARAEGYGRGLRGTGEALPGAWP